MEKVEEATREPKHMAIVSAIWRAEEQVSDLEELYNRIVGETSKKDPEQLVRETEPLASVLENIPKRIDELTDRINVLTAKLIEVLF